MNPLMEAGRHGQLRIALYADNSALSWDAAEPAIGIVGAPVLDVQQFLPKGQVVSPLSPDPTCSSRRRSSGADGCDHRCSAAGESSVTLPEPTPSSNSSMPIRRSTGVSPNSDARVKIESRVTPSRMDPVSSG